VTTASSGSYSTSTSSAASTASTRDPATTAATISPEKRTTSPARKGRANFASSAGNGGPNIPRSRSWAVKTWAFSAAGEMSMPAMRACASGERTKVTCSASSKGRFST
jgi:hypothetical protein